MDVQQGKTTEHDDRMDSADSDCILVRVTRPAFATKKRVFRSRSYVCHICPKNFEMQVSFIEHMKTEHPGSKLKCNLCIKLFVRPMDCLNTKDLMSTSSTFVITVHTCVSFHTKLKLMRIPTQKQNGLDATIVTRSSRAKQQVEHTGRHTLCRYSVIYARKLMRKGTCRFKLLTSTNVVCMALDGLLNAENILSGNPSFLSTLQKRTVKFASSIEQISSCSAFFFLKSLHYDFPFFRNIQVKWHSMWSNRLWGYMVFTSRRTFWNFLIIFIRCLQVQTDFWNFIGHFCKMFTGPDGLFETFMKFFWCLHVQTD